MKHLIFRIFILIIFSILFMSLFLGCGEESQKPSQNNSQDQKPPDSLLIIESSIDSIIDSLDKEGKLEDTGQQTNQQQTGQGQNQSSQNSGSQQSSQQGSQQSGNSQQDSQQGNQQSGSQQQGGQQGSQQSGGQQQNQQQNPWEQADKTIKTIHKKWNEFQPDAVKMGTSRDIVDGFGNDLNTLTNDIVSKNLMSTLNNANNLYKYIPEFLSHYKDKSVDIKRLKYYTRDVMYKSRFDKWDLANLSIESAKSVLPNIRSQANEDTKKLYQSLEYGVYDLEKVTKESQKNLVQLKGNVVLGDIKTIEANTKKESENQ